MPVHALSTAETCHLDPFRPSTRPQLTFLRGSSLTQGGLCALPQPLRSRLLVVLARRSTPSPVCSRRLLRGCDVRRSRQRWSVSCGGARSPRRTDRGEFRASLVVRDVHSSRPVSGRGWMEFGTQQGKLKDLDFFLRPISALTPGEKRG